MVKVAIIYLSLKINQLTGVNKMKNYLKLIDDLDATIAGLGDAHFKHPTVWYVTDHTGTKRGSLSEYKTTMWGKQHYINDVKSIPLNEFNDYDCYLMSSEWLDRRSTGDRRL